MAEKQLTVLERVNNLEKALSLTQNNNDEVSNSLRQSMQGALELLDALTYCVDGGAAKVEATLKARRAERAAQRVEQEKAQVEQLVGQGVLKVSEAITATSFIVGQLEYARLVEGVGEKFLGQSVGFTFTLDNGDKFEVLEVYEIQQPAVAEAAAPVATPEAPPPAVVEQSPLATTSN